MILDAFLFCGEQDICELRFRTLKDVVDKHIAVACSRTHQGQPLDREPVEKAFLRAGEAAGVRAILWWVEPSLTLVRNGRTLERGVDERGPAGSIWFQHVERQHRDGVVDAVRSVTSHPGSVIMVSDVDEIPDPVVVTKLDGYFADKQSMSAHEVARPHEPSDWLVFAQRMHSTYLDCLHPIQPWYGTCVSTLGDLRPQAHRDARTTIGTPQQSVTVIPDAGIHASWLGTDAERQRKLETFSHAELVGKFDPVDGRRNLYHANHEPLRKISLSESYEMFWPAPILDGSWKVPDGYLSEDAWEPDPGR